MKLKKTFENLLITNKNINEHFKISRETFELNIDSSQGPAKQLITAQKCPLMMQMMALIHSIQHKMLNMGSHRFLDSMNDEAKMMKNFRGEQESISVY